MLGDLVNTRTLDVFRTSQRRPSDFNISFLAMLRILVSTGTLSLWYVWKTSQRLQCQSFCFPLDVSCLQDVSETWAVFRATKSLTQKKSLRRLLDLKRLEKNKSLILKSPRRHFEKFEKFDLLSRSESVKFSLIKSAICLFTDSPVITIFFTVKSFNFHWSKQWNLADSQ